MPIRPENKHRYPSKPEWARIREAILERAGNCCEFCGVENHAIGQRDREGRFTEMPGMQSEAAALDGEKVIKIVLTIAHLDHQPENNDPENLRALCQKCHLNYDHEIHLENAAATRARKKREADLARGQNRMFDGEPD